MDTKSVVGAQAPEIWPALPYEAWKETLQTLHMWTQIVGKVRLALTPHVNHWWQVPLYISARGLTTSPIPYQDQLFEIVFDFLDHNLYILTSRGTRKILPLMPRTVADFYQDFMSSLRTLGIEVTINTVPSEVKNPIPCDQDQEHESYDEEYAQRFWRILVQTDKALMKLRSPFIGKSSPIHFFWGSFDLALTFFSGRPAPERPGADGITREAYSHEVISFGFWPGNEQFKEPAFYSYTAPVPTGLDTAPIRPASAFYSPDLGEFFLRYDDVRTAASPEQTLLAFFQSAYEAGATLAHWDRESLEAKHH